MACRAGRALALSLLEQCGGQGVDGPTPRDHDVKWQDHKKKKNKKKRKRKSVMLQQFFVRDLLVAHALDSHLFDGEEVLRGTDHCRCEQCLAANLVDGWILVLSVGGTCGLVTQFRRSCFFLVDW